MKYETITIISRIEDDVQAWTFQISEADLYELTQKYEASGCNIRGDAFDICDEIQTTYR